MSSSPPELHKDDVEELQRFVEAVKKTRKKKRKEKKREEKKRERIVEGFDKKTREKQRKKKKREEKKREHERIVEGFDETTREKQREKKKREFLDLFKLVHRAQVAVYKGARKHPVASCCAMAVLVGVAYLFGVSSVSYVKMTPEEALRDIDARSKALEWKFAAGGSTSFTPPDARRVDTEASRRPDQAKDLLARIVEGDFSRRSEVATGRFLREFAVQIILLLDVDRTNLQLARRGPDWLQLIGPYHLAEKRWMHRTHMDGYRLLNQASEAMIRLLKTAGGWKVEHIRVY